MKQERWDQSYFVWVTSKNLHHRTLLSWYQAFIIHARESTIKIKTTFKNYHYYFIINTIGYMPRSCQRYCNYQVTYLNNSENIFKVVKFSIVKSKVSLKWLPKHGMYKEDINKSDKLVKKKAQEASNLYKELWRP